MLQMMMRKKEQLLVELKKKEKRSTEKERERGEKTEILATTKFIYNIYERV